MDIITYLDGYHRVFLVQNYEIFKILAADSHKLEIVLGIHFLFTINEYARSLDTFMEWYKNKKTKGMKKGKEKERKL